MTLRVRFYPAALQELRSSHAWYEERSPGAGGDFVDEVFGVVDRLIEWPNSARRVELPELAGLDLEIRRAGTRRFEYGIVYYVRGSALWIVAIAHGKRRPNYWRTRLR